MRLTEGFCQTPLTPYEKAKGRRQGFILLGLLLIAGLVIWWRSC